jgi:hypothetical protein
MNGLAEPNAALPQLGKNGLTGVRDTVLLIILMKLLEQILAKIQLAAGAGDLERISRLNQLAKRVREIEEGTKAFDAELAQITSEVEGKETSDRTYQAVASPPIHSGPIVVTIDFPHLGVNHAAVVISERQASDTMRRVIEALVAAKGPSILQSLTQLRVNRGPIVTQDPEHDYKNPQTGQLYAHQPVGSTGFFVLTHSATVEKVRDLGLVAETLGLSPLHFRVRKNEEMRSN